MIQALVALVNDPEPEHPLRAELAEEYMKDRKKFIKNAEEFTKKHSEKRPSDWEQCNRLVEVCEYFISVNIFKLSFEIKSILF